MISRPAENCKDFFQILQPFSVFTAPRTGSTKKDIKVEVCSKCHPFYTGKQKMVDTGGRVSRFNKKFGLG